MVWLKRLFFFRIFLEFLESSVGLKRRQESPLGLPSSNWAWPHMGFTSCPHYPLPIGLLSICSSAFQTLLGRTCNSHTNILDSQTTTSYKKQSKFDIYAIQYIVSDRLTCFLSRTVLMGAMAMTFVSMFPKEYLWDVPILLRSPPFWRNQILQFLSSSAL